MLASLFSFPLIVGSYDSLPFFHLLKPRLVSLSRARGFPFI